MVKLTRSADLSKSLESFCNKKKKLRYKLTAYTFHTRRSIHWSPSSYHPSVSSQISEINVNINIFCFKKLFLLKDNNLWDKNNNSKLNKREEQSLFVEF